MTDNIDKLVLDVVEAIAAVAGNAPVGLHEPSFRGNEWQYLKQCLDSTYVSSVGKFVDRFESDLAEFTGAKHAIAVVNGTAALHTALMLAGVRAGDEVIAPALSFVATANAIHYCGATPHFVDSHPTNLGIDPDALRSHLTCIGSLNGDTFQNKNTGRPIRAIVLMHVFGHPADIPALMEVARDFNLRLVEDAAESLGSYFEGRHTGTFGMLGAISFNGNKIITTGGGGAILTDSPDLARRAKHITTTAKLPHRWEYVHDEIGYNYRMPNLNAALGCAQLEQLPAMLSAKRLLFEKYLRAFSGMDGVAVVSEPKGCQSNYWLQTIRLEHGNKDFRNSILEAINEAGYMARPIWAPLHTLPPFSNCPRAPMPVVESLERTLINLPSSSFLATANREGLGGNGGGGMVSGGCA